MSRLFLSSFAVTLLACGGGGGGGGDGAVDARVDGRVDAEPDAGSLCVDDGSCDDGVFCNGPERCVADAAGDERCAPASGGPCMASQECDEVADVCETVCDVEEDADGDGAVALACGGDDCDDANPDAFPSATEVCDEGDVDEDCDPTTFGDTDVDGDGVVSAACCNMDAAGALVCGTDCTDTMASVRPLAAELCNGLDDDCDGVADEGVTVSMFADLDGDLHGDPDAPIDVCPGTGAGSFSVLDCDDADPSRHRGQLEICDGVDNDCDEAVDEESTIVTWYADLDGDGYGTSAGATRASCEVVPGFSLLATDCDDDDAMVHPAAAELCNGRDDDCDGVADFPVGDGGEDDDRDGVPDVSCPDLTVPADCDDLDGFAGPDTPELCDEVDNDCDGTVDEAVVDQTWFADVDGDGFGDDADSLSSCERQPDRVLRGGDCADDDGERRPAARELCNGLDDDCDGTVDEGAAVLALYADMDEDGFGAGAPTFGCSTVSGMVTRPGDCDDDALGVHPDATELCDVIDQDCDGAIDDAPACAPMIYLTQTPIDAGAGVAGMDALCNSDPRHPGGVYKAMVAASTRRACTTANCAGGADAIDWVFQPDTDYRRLDGLPIFRTDANAIVTSLPLTNDVRGTGVNFWLGFDISWVPVPAEGCLDWTSESGAQRATVGWDQVTDAGWISGGRVNCNQVEPIVCVQQ